MSSLLIPIFVLSIIFYGYYKKIDVYSSFVDGAKEGIVMTKNMFPPLLAMIFAVNIFSKSGVINYLLFFLKPLFEVLNIPFEILPIAILRPLSGSFGLGLLNDIYLKYGVDSFISVLSSVVQGSTDTTIYIITLYFGTLGIKKIRYALWVGLIADFIMVLLSILLVPLLT
ncbi:MAG: spore maturation protein [Bacilli bacterium]|nr:spore maturation protein [Bacilli bacterium]